MDSESNLRSNIILFNILKKLVSNYPDFKLIFQIPYITHRIGLLAQQEIQGEGLSIEELKPYTTILGIDSQELLSPVINDATKLRNKLMLLKPHIEHEIEDMHKKVLKFLNMQSFDKIFSFIKTVQGLESNISNLRHKQQRALQGHIHNLQHCSKLLHELSQRSDGSHLSLKKQQLDIRSDISELSLELIDRNLSADLYTERKLAALGVIREELETVIVEQEQIKEETSEKLADFNRQPELLKMFEEYSNIWNKIHRLQGDIAALDSH
jgi:hypothetical protein